MSADGFDGYSMVLDRQGALGRADIALPLPEK